LSELVSTHTSIYTLAGKLNLLLYR